MEEQCVGSQQVDTIPIASIQMSLCPVLCHPSGTLIECPCIHSPGQTRVPGRQAASPL